jgi:hypothetical protein
MLSGAAARMRRLIIQIALLALLFPRIARGDETNPHLLPIGEREAMMGNAGITSVGPAAAYYNPANLAYVEHPSLSLTGTTLLRFDLTTDAFYVVGDEDVPFEASGLTIVPASLVSTYKVGPVSLATSVLVPDAFEISNRTTFVFEGATSTLVQKLSREDLWLGVAAAGELGEHVAVGV